MIRVAEVVSLSRFKSMLLLAFLVSCDFNEATNLKTGRTNNYEVATSSVGMFSWYRKGDCVRVLHRNILIRNDSLYIEGKLKGEWGQYARQLSLSEVEQMEQYLEKYPSAPRKEKSPEEGSFSSLYIKKGDVVVDSLKDTVIEWRKDDVALLTFISKLACTGELSNLAEKQVYYPSAKMVTPPPRVTVPFNKK
ncbi:hypothetical protein [Pontibacter fetidus]|uniref:Lipoprotein n=1 Tax=Pontibacter fetidus TaxID=2700082 RepID=A0A6B2GTQ2_9BACT|nr:hypothetical protein [Pontibacter fetidus]NDK54289.1 hypothetical protein [Pontibacter fetidus]